VNVKSVCGAACVLVVCLPILLLYSKCVKA
jgi:hypothetical protein